MKATWNGATIAEADKDDLIRIEGNWYFPPSALSRIFSIKRPPHHMSVEG